MLWECFETPDSPSLLAWTILFYLSEIFSYQISNFSCFPVRVDREITFKSKVSPRNWVHFFHQLLNSIETHLTFRFNLLFCHKIFFFIFTNCFKFSVLILAIFKYFSRTKIFFVCYSKSRAPWHEACNTPTDNINKKKTSFTNSELFNSIASTVFESHTQRVMSDGLAGYVAKRWAPPSFSRGYVHRRWFYARFYVCLNIITYVVAFCFNFLVYNFEASMANSLIEKLHFLRNINGECSTLKSQA